MWGNRLGVYLLSMCLCIAIALQQCVSMCECVCVCVYLCTPLGNKAALKPLKVERFKVQWGKR